VGKGRLLAASRANPKVYRASPWVALPAMPLRVPPSRKVDHWFWLTHSGEAQLASLKVLQRFAESGWLTVHGRKLNELVDSSDARTVLRLLRRVL
jgi:hypothetical protein